MARRPAPVRAWLRPLSRWDSGRTKAGDPWFPADVLAALDVYVEPTPALLSGFWAACVTLTEARADRLREGGRLSKADRGRLRSLDRRAEALLTAFSDDTARWLRVWAAPVREHVAGLRASIGLLQSRAQPVPSKRPSKTAERAFVAAVGAALAREGHPVTVSRADEAPFASVTRVLFRAIDGAAPVEVRRYLDHAARTLGKKRRR